MKKSLRKIYFGLAIGIFAPTASYAGAMVTERYSVAPSQCYAATSMWDESATRCAISVPARFFQTGNNTLAVRFKKSCFPAPINGATTIRIMSGEVPKGWSQPVDWWDDMSVPETRSIGISPDGDFWGTVGSRVYDLGGGIMEYQFDLQVWPVAAVDTYWPRTEAVDFTKMAGYANPKPLSKSCITAVELTKWIHVTKP